MQGMVLDGRTPGKGFDQWMTPPAYIAKARKVMGSIDLDPASSFIAQEYHQAKEFCISEQEANELGYGLAPPENCHVDGLSINWHGNVWCNPPYSRNNIDAFTAKAIQEWLEGDSYMDDDNFNRETYESKYVTEMMLLVNSQTDTGWYHMLLQNCTCVLLVRGRIKFWKMFDDAAHPVWEGALSKERGENKVGNSPRYLNSIFYFSRRGVDDFQRVFGQEGTIVHL